MEQGGLLYWSELYPSVGVLDGTDPRNLLIPSDIKYELMREVFDPLGDSLGVSISAWEEYDILCENLPSLYMALKSINNTNDDIRNWKDKAIQFVEKAIRLKKDISLVL